jgi:rhamnosyltransferase
MNTLAILTVTFNPEISRLKLQLEALPNDAFWVVVDNASSQTAFNQIKLLVESRPNSRLIRNDTNRGLAAASNQAAKAAQSSCPIPTHILLMDQDSIPLKNAINILLNAHSQLEKQGERIGCVGPKLIDRSTGLQHGFHCIQQWRWTRALPKNSDAPISCANINGSGTLVRSDLFESLGGLDEALFIDHVDTEWAFRVLSNQRKIFGIPSAIFDHAMGEKSLRFWFLGWRIWPQRSPLRHYYLFRNALWLMQRNYVPTVWKVWAVMKLILTIAVHCSIDPQRHQQAKKMFSGIMAGIANKKNDIPSL